MSHGGGKKKVFQENCFPVIESKEWFRIFNPAVENLKKMLKNLETNG